MFKEMAQMAALMKHLPRIKEEIPRFQQRMGQITAEGDAGAGMVRVRANGRMELLSCNISPEAMKTGDHEMLGDLIIAAANQALTRARQQTADEARQIATSLGLPAGFEIPGLT